MSASRDLRSLDWIKKQAADQAMLDLTRQTAGLPRGTLRGTICDVDDPENRGRVRVCFDDMNPDIPQVYGAGEYSQPREGTEPDLSHWIDVSPAFKGKQPKGMVGKRVSIAASNGQFQFAVLQSDPTLFDPQMLAKGKQKDLKMPNNSSMTRLPIYGQGELPPAGEDNHGCMVIEQDGPMNSDWLCVCLKRNGEYIWVRHVDLQHGHAGENDGKQPNDSAGDNEEPVNEQSVWDYVFPTSAQEMPKTSAYGTNPRPNPYGRKATWNPPPT
jgi:hypothetical protein